MTQGFSTVLVTGASGFIAEHCILQLLQQGYAVRGVVRTPSSADNVKQTLAKHVDSEGKLGFAHADLLHDEGWDKAVAGCKYILHVASPYPPGPPKHEDDLIIPARDGTLRVLRAAASAGVKRVVLTSSLAAVVPGHDDKKTLDEDDWSDPEKGIGAYQKSKTLERIP